MVKNVRVKQGVYTACQAKRGTSVGCSSSVRPSVRHNVLVQWLLRSVPSMFVAHAHCFGIDRQLFVYNVKLGHALIRDRRPSAVILRECQSPQQPNLNFEPQSFNHVRQRRYKSRRAIRVNSAVVVEARQFCKSYMFK